MQESEALDVIVDDNGRAEALNAVFCDATSETLNPLYHYIYFFKTILVHFQ